MIEKQNEIINKINNLDEVKRLKELKSNLDKNEDYKRLMSKPITSNKELIEIRKELFKIDDYKEYQELYNKIKLFFLKINGIIVSIVDNKKCSKGS